MFIHAEPKPKEGSPAATATATVSAAKEQAPASPSNDDGELVGVGVVHGGSIQLDIENSLAFF